MSDLTRRAALLAALAVTTGFALPASAKDQEITIFAAASLKTALDEITRAWAAQTGGRALVSYAGSSALAKQIALGAPADLFLSASVDWMDWLQQDGLIKPETRVDLLGNRLVLVAHDEDAGAAEGTLESVDLATVDLAGLLGENKLAMALVDSVPAGIYGKAALTHLGLWDRVAPQVVQVDNVRAALALVATGEAPLGIVYATDALAEPRVRVLGSFPAPSHAPIRYPAAVTAQSRNPAARAFLAYLSSPTAKALFAGHGFQIMAR